MFYPYNNNRNHSMFSKRGSDGHFRRFTQNVPVHLKLSNSKTLIQLCHTDRSQSQANQTSNNLLGYSQDNIQSPHSSQFHIKTYIRFKPSRIFPISQPSSQLLSNQMKKIAIIDKKKILCQDNFFTYDHIFEQLSTQKDIYNHVCKQMVQHFIRGFNSTIFAYGQTGSGKTYTMFGDVYAEDEKRKGIVPQVIKDIYTGINNIQGNVDRKENQKCQIVVSCSMLEIYKESMIDLLSIEKLDLKIKQHQIFNVANLTIKQVNNQQQMHQVLKMGNQSKKIRQTNMNQASSRSHVIFTIYLQVKKQNQRRLSKFNLVDLAGSQKVSKSKVQGQGLEQAKKINLSLSCLGNTINALLKGNDHIPFRESKLTRLLYESLGGNSLTRLIVTCSSQDTQIQETLSSLKFASRAKNLKTNPLINTLRKSQKSVSRIAYQNLKTNLHKAENKLRKIHILTDQLKNRLGKNKNIINENKQNQSFISNKNLNKYEQNLKNNQMSQQKSIDEFLTQITLILVGNNKNKDSDMIMIQKTKNNDYHQTQTILNPFLMITTQNQQKPNFHQKSQNKTKQIIQNHKKPSIPNITQITSSKNQTHKYWQIIKQQQKQIQQLQIKFKKSQQKSSNTISIQTIKKQYHSNNNNDLISTQICKQIQSCRSSNFKTKLNQSIQKEERKSSQKKNSNSKQKEMQNVNVKMTKKLLNIKLATNNCLPIRQISLNSPTYKTSDFNKKSTIFHNSKSISRKNSDQNFFNQKVQSPREFNLVEVENSDKTLQNLLKQITKRLNHRNEYEKFQKRILLKQVQLMCEQKLHKKLQIQGKLSNLSSTQETRTTQQKILKQQTNQLLTLQSKYIDQLQNSLINLKNKNYLNINDQQQKKQQQAKLKINAIKFR